MIFSQYTLFGRKLNFGGHPMRTVIALTGCAVVTMLAGCDQLSVDKEIDTTTAATDPGYSVTGAELIETDASGLPRYRLTADRIVQDPVSLQINIEQPRLGLNEAGDPAWTVSADRGQLPAHARAIRLEGHVEVSSARANDQPALQVATDALDYDFVSSIARTDTLVSLTLDGHRLQGMGLEADLRRRQAQLKESVQGRFTP
jgi:lipopolysaccharide export system protein LptC